MWKRTLLAAAVVSVSALSGTASAAATGGVFSTDRLSYTGTVVRYDTLADAQNGLDATETIAIGVDVAGDNNREHRDASFYFVDNAPAYDTDNNVLTSSWWYTVNGAAGNGNINGNTGIGFMQLYDDNGSTDSSISMDFSNFDGTHWTDFTLSAQGENGSLDGPYQQDGNIYDSLFVANVPAAAWLFGSALLGLGLVKRRKA